jgi:hypothetical protein
MKMYRLLRNNKETGPYSAEELIKTGFKKYDLIWLDGKSAAWRYPGELPDFAQHAPVIEEQPFDRFYKRPVVSTTAPIEMAAIVTPVIAETPAIKKEKPRIRIKADSARIEVPSMPVATEEVVAKVVTAPIAASTATPAILPAWNDVWLNWEQEKQSAGGAKPQPKKAIAPTFEPEIETVLLHTLPTSTPPIKKSNFLTSNTGLTIILLLIITGIGFWMHSSWSDSSANSTHNTTADNVAPNIAANTDTIQIISDPVATATNNQQVQTILPDVPENKPAAEQSTAEKPNSFVVTAVKNTEKPVAKPAAVKPQIKPAALPAVNSKTVVANTIQQPATKQVKTTSQEVNAALPKKETAPVNDGGIKSIGHYIHVDANIPYANETTGINYTIENTSDIPLELVMIDLQYYDIAGHYIKGETIYLRNVDAGEKVNAKAPDNAKAATVRYKVSMISSEKKNLYLIAD